MHSTRSSPRARLWVCALVLLALLAAACGGDDDDTADPGTDDTTTTEAPDDGDEADEPDDDSGDEPEGDGPGTPAPQPLDERVVVTAATPFLAIEAYSPFLVADYYEEFEKENIELKVEIVQHPDALVLLLDGTLDFAPISLFAGLFNAIGSGADLRIVAGGPGFSPDTQSGFWARTEYFEDGEPDPCDFEGSTWALGAVMLGSVNGLSAADFLAQCDLSINDITVSPLQGTDALVALQNGAIDVANLIDPVWQAAAEDGSAQLLIPASQLPGAGIVMGPFRHEQPEVAEAVLRALVRTQRTYLQGDYRSDPEVRAALIEAMDAPPETLETGKPLIFYPNMEFPELVFQPLQDMWFEAGGIVAYDEPLADDELLDLSILERITGQ